MVGIEIDDRVLVDGKRGVVRFAGTTEFCSGFWYGVELDECKGFNDGSVGGKRYFEIQGRRGNYGIFAQLEDLNKIDDSAALRDENRKLTSLVEALERKIRQLHVKRSQSKQDLINTELQRTLEILTQEREKYDAAEEEIVSIREENKKLHAKLESLQVKEAETDDVRAANVPEPQGYLAQEPASDKDLTVSLQDENTELSNALISANKKLNALKEDNRHYEALQGIYIEIENELRDQLSALEEYIFTKSDEKVSHTTPVSDVMKTRIFKDLCGIIFPSSMPSLTLLRIQYSFMLKYLANEESDLPIPYALAGRLYFSVLHELTGEDLTECADVLHEDFGNNSAIFNGLLSGRFQKSLFETYKLIQFIRGSQSLDSNFNIMISIVLSFFGELLPQLLVYHKKKVFSDNMLASISKLYSISLSIEERAKNLYEQSRNDTTTTFVSKIHLSDVLEVAFSIIKNEPEIEGGSFESFEVPLKGIFDCLRQTENFPAASNRKDSNLVLPDVDMEIEMAHSDEGRISDWKFDISEKEAKIRELAVKVQLLEVKLEEAIISEAANLRMRDTATEPPKVSDTVGDEMPHLEKRQPQITVSSDQEELTCAVLENFMSNSQLEVLTQQSINSEINDLRRVVASLTKQKNSETPAFKWLYNRRANSKPITKTANFQLKNKIQDLATSSIEIAQCSKILTYQEKHQERQKKYISNAAFKQKVLDLKIKDLIA